MSERLIERQGALHGPELEVKALDEGYQRVEALTKEALRKGCIEKARRLIREDMYGIVFNIYETLVREYRKERDFFELIINFVGDNGKILKIGLEETLKERLEIIEEYRDSLINWEEGIEGLIETLRDQTQTKSEESQK